MNFEKLIEKIKNGKYDKANYQLVVICHLSQKADFRDNKKSIAEVLKQKNKTMKREVTHFMNCPVWRVLTNKGIISKISDGYKLNTKLTKSEQTKIMKLCKELLK